MRDLFCCFVLMTQTLYSVLMYKLTEVLGILKKKCYDAFLMSAKNF